MHFDYLHMMGDGELFESTRTAVRWGREGGGGEVVVVRMGSVPR